MANTTNIVPPRVQMVDPATGNITREWYRFFLNMFDLTGAGNNDDSIVVALVTPPTLEAQFDFFPVSDARAEQYMDIQTRLEPIVDQLMNLQLAFDTQPIIQPSTPPVSSTPRTYTANFTVADVDTWVINNKSGSTCTVTLPSASLWGGRAITLQNYQAQTLVSASSNVVPLGGGAAGTAILENVAGNWATLVSNGTNWVMMQYAPNNILLLE